jgi:hypothetical protein
MVPIHSACAILSQYPARNPLPLHMPHGPLFESTVSHIQCFMCPGLLLLSLRLWRQFTALAAAVSCSAASAGEGVRVCNIHVQLDIMRRKNRGERATDIAPAIQVPERMIHIIMSVRNWNKGC